MRERLLRQFGPASLGLFVVLALAVQGCFSVRLVSPYDDQTDQAVTGLYRNIMAYMADLRSKPQVTGPDSVSRAQKYEAIRLDIGVMKLRVSAKEKNQQQIEQVNLLADNWVTVGKLEKTNPPPEAIENARSGMETMLTAILKLEEAKK